MSRAAPAWRAFGRWSPYSARSYQSYSDYEWNGSYRTLCVRLCDGYYFPVSYRTSRNRMHRDARICETSCDCETRLFYLPSSSSNMSHAVDLTGQSYAKLDNAFEYRTAYDKSCSCRPMPSEESEVSRHERYAMAEAERREDIVSRRAEVLANLLEREDEKAAREEEQRLAELEEKQLRELERNRRKAIPDSLRLPLAQLQAESEPALEAMPDEYRVDAPLIIVGGAGSDMGPADVSESTFAEVQVSRAEIEVEATRREPTVKSVSYSAGRPAAGRSKPARTSPVKVSRPASRGFWQM